MKANKLMMAALFVGALAMVSCKKTPQEPEVIVTPPTPGTETTMPTVNVPSGKFVLAAKITTTVCGKVVIEGGFQGWDLKSAPELEPLSGNAGWYTIALPAGEDLGNCKMLLSDDGGNIPEDWSSQWNSELVTILEGDAELVDDQGQQAMNFSAEEGAVVYIQVDGWQNSPCVDYGIATNAQLKCAGNDWTYADMTKVSDGVFTIESIAGYSEEEGTQTLNLGANIGVNVGEDFIESWNPAPTIVGGDIAIGDAIVYTFTSTNGPKGTLEVAKK